MRENQDPGSLRKRLDWEEKGIPLHLHIFLTSLPCALLLALTLFHFISTFHLYRHHFEMIPSIFMYRKKRAIFKKNTIEAVYVAHLCNPDTEYAEAGELSL